MEELYRKWDELEALLINYGIPEEVVENQIEPLIKESTVEILKDIVSEFKNYLENKEEK